MDLIPLIGRISMYELCPNAITLILMNEEK
jgi:hypothetical protein